MMRNWKIRFLAVSLLVVGIVGGALWFRTRDVDGSKRGDDASCDSSRFVESPPSACVSIVRTSPVATKKKSSVVLNDSFSLENFDKLTVSDKLSLLHSLMDSSDLGSVERGILRREMNNPDNSMRLRNDAANVLLVQSVVDDAFVADLLGALHDVDEAPVWRDYCIQFLSAMVDKVKNPNILTDAIVRQAAGRDDKSGTAVIHVAQLEAAGAVIAPVALSSEEILDKLNDPSTSPRAKSALLMSVGMRKDKRLLKVVRSFADQDDERVLKRVAIATLGIIGDYEDLPRMKLAVNHYNRAVVLAAKGALVRLKKSLARSKTGMRRNL